MAEAPVTDDLFRKSTAAALWSYAGAVAKVMLQFVIQVALARMLGPHVYGQFAVILALVGIGWLLSDGGFGAALIQKKDLTEADIRTAIGWVLVIGCLVGGTLSLVAPITATFFAEPSLAKVFLVVGPIVVVHALSNIPLSLLRRDLDAKRVQAIQVGSYGVAFGVVGLGLARLGFGVWSLVCAFALQSVLGLLMAYLCTRHAIRPLLRGDRNLRRFGFKVMLTNVVNWAGDNLDRLIIGKVWGVSALGGYSAANNLVKSPMGMFVGSIQSIVLASGAKSQDDHKSLRDAYVAMLSIVALISLPGFLIVSVHANAIVRLIYGNEWVDAAPLLQALSLGVPFLIVSAVTGPLLWAIDKVQVELKIQIISTAVLLVLLLALGSTDLSKAVWLIPAIALAKAGFLVGGLAKRIGLTLPRVLIAHLPAAMLSGCVVATTLALRMAPLNDVQRLTCTVAALFFCGITVRRHLLAPELRDLLVERRADSRLMSGIAAFLGL